MIVLHFSFLDIISLSLFLNVVLVVAAGTAANDPFCGYYAKEGSFFFYAEMKLVKSWLESSL